MQVFSPESALLASLIKLPVPYVIVQLLLGLPKVVFCFIHINYIGDIMKYIAKPVVLLPLLFTSVFFQNPAHAGTAKNSQPVTLESYRLQASGTRFLVHTQDPIDNPANCARGSSDKMFYIVRSDSSEATRTVFDQFFASVIAAKHNNSQIEIWISDDTCSSNRPIVELIKVN